MQAIVQERYGSPDVLTLRDVETPEIGDDGVLVRVRATSVNAADWHTLRGRPLLGRLVGMGLRRPNRTVLGTDVAGLVEAVGRDVTELRPGDEVFGGRDGSFAEYVAGRVRNFVPKPADLTFDQAAAIPVAATTALQALRDKGQVRDGQRVLIIGAGGGVGTFTVQLAKAFGATVTAVTTADKVELARSLGADEVVDYTREDVTRSGRRFDLVLDVGGYRTLRDLGRAVGPGGTVVVVGAGDLDSLALASRLAAGPLLTRLRGRRFLGFLAHITRDDLLVLGELAAAGKIAPVIDRTYPLRDAAEAIRYVETGQVRGKVVITM